MDSASNLTNGTFSKINDNMESEITVTLWSIDSSYTSGESFTYLWILYHHALVIWKIWFPEFCRSCLCEHRSVHSNKNNHICSDGQNLIQVSISGSYPSSEWQIRGSVFQFSLEMVSCIITIDNVRKVAWCNRFSLFILRGICPMNALVWVTTECQPLVFKEKNGITWKNLATSVQHSNHTTLLVF